MSHYSFFYNKDREVEIEVKTLEFWLIFLVFILVLVFILRRNTEFQHLLKWYQHNCEDIKIVGINMSLRLLTEEELQAKISREVSRVTVVISSPVGSVHQNTVVSVPTSFISYNDDEQRVIVGFLLEDKPWLDINRQDFHFWTLTN